MDPVGDWLFYSGESYTDILAVSVNWSGSDRLQFSLQAAAPIPSAPGGYLAYVWGIDTDNNPNTGYGWPYIFANDIGIDVLLRVAYRDGRWGAWVDKAGANGVAEWSQPVYEYSIDGSTSTGLVSVSTFGIPESFTWTAHSLQGGDYFDIAPNSGHLLSP